MSGNRAAGLLGVIAAISVSGAAIAAARETGVAAAHRCPPAGAHMIAHDRFVRVYTTGTGPLSGHAVEACLTGRRGRMTLLAAASPGAGPGGRSLAVDASSGPLIAYSLTSFGVDSGSTSLVVADVDARRVLRRLTVGHYVDAGFAGYERITQVALGPEGAVGWIAAAKGPGEASQTYSVHAAATVGEPRVLDEGPDIGPESLTLTGGTLHWWHAGIEHSAPLP
jgi:hypothetical protein